MHDHIKVAVITGGTRGIGLAISLAFVHAGYRVVVGARQASDIEKRAPDKLLFIPGDASKAESHAKWAQAANDWGGGLSAYVNNAGISSWRELEGITEPFIDAMLAINLKSVIWGCKAAASTMRSGAIINISSLAGKRGSAKNTVYCASKFAVNGVTQALAKELGIRQIRVNAVCPVLVKSPGLMDALGAKDAPAAGDPEQFLARFNAENSALGRLPEADDVAQMCIFLASPQAAAISGQCLNVDCGVFPQ